MDDKRLRFRSTIGQGKVRQRVFGAREAKSSQGDRSYKDPIQVAATKSRR